MSGESPLQDEWREGGVMVRDGVANVVERLKECGFDPRRVGPDSWEARCPAHRSSDHALSITRNEFNHAVLECRSADNCEHMRIIRSLGFANDHLYRETPDLLISRLSRVPIQPASFTNADEREDLESSPAWVEAAKSLPEPARAPDERNAEADATPASDHGPNNGIATLEALGAQEQSSLKRESSCTAESPSPHSVQEPARHRPEDTQTLEGETSLCEQGAGKSLELPGPDPSAGTYITEIVESESSLQVLLRVASSARYFRTGEGRLFAHVPVGSRHEVHGLKSSAFRDWLIDGYFADCGEIPSQWVIRRVLTVLEARARYGAGRPSVFIRVGGDGSENPFPYYLDLGDASGRAVEIRPEGWGVVDRPGVHFRRPEGLLALPEPSGDGSIDLLRPYVNLSDRDFRLLIAWMAAALRPVGPYPILALYGEQAAAKSTLARVIRLVIDPQAAPLLAIPRSNRDLMVTGNSGWLLAYDNISVITDAISDGLCMVSTGGAYAGRALFSNDERSVVNVQRPVILSGIEEFIRRGDLSDRSVYLNLPPIPPINRRREDEFWPAFLLDQPKILGGLLDAIVGGLQMLPSIKVQELPRMADFAAFGEAVGRALRWPAGAFLADYADNRREATLTQLEDSLVGTILLQLSDRMPDWTGTPSKLLSALNQGVSKQTASAPRWPKSPAWLTNELRRIAPQLRLHGLSVTSSRNSRGRVLTITKVNQS